MKNAISFLFLNHFYSVLHPIVRHSNMTYILHTLDSTGLPEEATPALGDRSACWDKPDGYTSYSHPGKYYNQLYENIL